MPEIITRAEAKARGLKRYFTGKPCSKGHIEHRNLVNGSCVKCVREKAYEHVKKWRKSNPEKYREQQKRRYRSEKYLERAKQWVKANPEKRREISRRYREKHKQACREYARKKWKEIKPKYLTDIELKERRLEHNRKFHRLHRKERNEKQNERRKKWTVEQKKRNYEHQRKYMRNGPIKPRGQSGWLRRNKAQLRSVKRVIKNLRRGLPPSQISASMTPTDLRR